MDRLNKRIVLLGLTTSRRKADQLIKLGEVKVNGKVVTDLATLVNEKDFIKVKGKLAKEISKEIIISFNKPKGYVCSHNPQFGQKTIFSLLPNKFANLKIAGRLDKQSQGLMILSSNGSLINKLTHPSYNHQKTYLVWLNMPIKNDDAKKLIEPHYLDGGKAIFDSIKVLQKSCIKVVLSQGINRQIRRIFDRYGYKVIKLERIGIAKLKLDDLRSGKHKVINADNIL